MKGNIISDKKAFTANHFEAPNRFGEKKLVFKNNAPFINCISKINGVKIDNAEDLDVVMPMYNLLEYSKNYKKQQVVCGIIIKMNQIVIQMTMK